MQGLHHTACLLLALSVLGCATRPQVTMPEGYARLLLHGETWPGVLSRYQSIRCHLALNGVPLLNPFRDRIYFYIDVTPGSHILEAALTDTTIDRLSAAEFRSRPIAKWSTRGKKTRLLLSLVAGQTREVKLLVPPEACRLDPYWGRGWVDHYIGLPPAPPGAGFITYQ